MNADGFETTVKKVVQLLTERASQYYPQLAGESIGVRVVRTSTRKFSIISELEISSKSFCQTLLVKIARNTTQFETASSRDPIQSYVIPGPDPKGAEFAALTEVGRFFDGLGDSRFFSIPVVDSLFEGRVLVLEKVAASSLNSLLRSGAFPVVLPGSRLRILGAVARAGAWLRCFHRIPDGEMVRDRGTSRIDFVNVSRMCGSYLKQASRDGGFLKRVVEPMVDAAYRFLPEQLPSSTLHDDFAPRNILVDQSGRIGVIDTLLEWRGCIWEDLAQFVVSLHTNKLRTLSCGVLFSRRFLQEVEEVFINAYFDSENIPWAAIRLYQAQNTLIKWAALANGQQQCSKSSRAVRLAISARQYEAYIHDRLRLMEKPAPGSVAQCRSSLGDRG